MRYIKRSACRDSRLLLSGVSILTAASKCLGQLAVGDPTLSDGWDSSSDIVVTASGSHNSIDLPENTVLGDNNPEDPNLFDSSGQFVEGPQASNTPSFTPSMWLSGQISDSAENPDPTGITDFSHWIEFSFNQSYSIGQMWIWNGNQDSTNYNYDDQGLQDVTIQYTDDGFNWTTVSTAPIPEATNLSGSNLYSPVSQIVNFNGARVKDVVITAAPTNYNYSGGTSQNVALSAVRFYQQNQAPVQVPSPLSPPPTRPFYYGYYFAETSVYGDYMDKVIIPPAPGSSYGTRLYDYTNLTLILDDTRYGSPDPHRTLVDAVNLGYKCVVYGAGFNQNDPSSWSTGFASLEQVINGYQKDVYALDLVDEPDGNGWTRSQMEALASAAESYFGGSVPITMNLDDPTNGQAPRNLDLYMFDYYINTSGTTTFAQYTAGVNADLNAIRGVESGKPILMLGDSFGGGGYGFPSLQQQEWYYNTAVSNSDVNGLMWFMMGNASQNNPALNGAISSPSSLAFQALLGQTALPRPSPAFDERFDEYSSQAQLNAAWSGVTPMLTSAMDHGNNGGNSVEFGIGSVNATRQISPSNETGSVSAYFYDNLTNFGQYIGFRAINAQGQSVAVFANGATSDYNVMDQANNVTSQDTGTATISDDWQKVEFDFNGSGVSIYIDSLLVYQMASGWTGGFSQIGFYDPGGTTNPGGFIDDILVYQTPPVTATWDNAGASGDGETWDTAMPNWNINGTPSAYANGNAAVFNDSNNGNYSVTLNTVVTPNSVTIDNSHGNYTFSGSGGIGGNEPLFKSGTATATLSTVNTYSGGTNVSAGKLIIGVNGALPDGAVTITGGTLQLGMNTGLATITFLSISGGGVLDVNDNRLILTYTGASPIETIAGYVASGYNGGFWNGPGIVTTAPLSVNGLRYGVGYADGADRVVAGLSSGQIEVRYTLLGDANLDGVVNGSDFSILAANFGHSVKGWDQGDFDYNGVVNGSDFSSLAANFGQGVGGPSAVSVADLQALEAFAVANGLSMPNVPEPAALGLMALSSKTFLFRRRRHRNGSAPI